MTLLRYDPDRVAALRQRALEAAGELAALTSGDPAAGAAIAAARLAGQRLEAGWLPLLDRLLRSDAMLSFVAAGPGGGAALGRELADLAVTVGRGDADPLTLRDALIEAAGDGDAVEAFLVTLGGTGLADLLLALGSGADDDAVLLATTIRTTLAGASRRPGFPAGVAGDVVARLAGTRPDVRRNPAVALSFLFDDTTYGTTFLVRAVTTLVDTELEAAGDEPEHGDMLWAMTMQAGGPGSVLARALDDRFHQGSSELYRSGDPMYALMECVAGDGAAGRALFTDERIARYLLGQRPFPTDGLRSLAAAAERASAGPGLGPSSPPAVLRDASLVASAFVNHVGSRPQEDLEYWYTNAEVTRSAATILGQHLFAVHSNVLVGGPLRPPAGRVGALADAARGEQVTVGAMFDDAALDHVTDLAADTDEGVATIRAALDLYQRSQAHAGVARVAGGEIAPAEANAFLTEAMTDAARLEAHFVEHAGNRAERHGRHRDDVIRLWIDLATFATDRGRAAVGGAPAVVLGEILDPLAGELTDELATHQDTAARTAEQQAGRAADQLLHVWYQELYGQRVLTPDLPAEAVSGGRLVGWTEFQELDGVVQQLVRNRMEEHRGPTGIDLNGQEVLDAIKVEQLPYYRRLTD